MPFPQTRHTLIERLAAGGDQRDWRDFLADYWGPVCRFALRRGETRPVEAEDIASQTFEVVLRNKLLGRWVASRQAKLRTLLCSVVCKIQANTHRAADRRQWLIDDLESAGPDAASLAASEEQADAFLEAWVEDLLQKCLHELAAEYHRAGKGDYFRVLYGRLCDEMSIAEVAEALAISPSAVDNYYRHVRRRLAEKLQSAVRSHVFRYCAQEEAEKEFVAEWNRLGAHLKEHGGLEEAVRRTYELADFQAVERSKTARIRDTISRIESSGRPAAR
jgi:RNA polymerase sigma factor (sigma-70 family)